MERNRVLRQQRKHRQRQRYALLCGWTADNALIAREAREFSAEEVEYNRDLLLRIRNNQVGSGMRYREEG